MGMYDRWLSDYSRRYIRTGSGAPVFHAMGLIFGIGTLIHFKAHHDRLKDPKWVPDH